MPSSEPEVTFIPSATTSPKPDSEFPNIFDDWSDDDKVKVPNVKAVKKNNIKVSYKNGKLNLKWKKVSKSSGYQVQISDKKKFNKAKSKTITKTKYTIKKNISSKVCYVRIRTFKNYNDSGTKKKFYSKWTTVKVKIR